MKFFKCNNGQFFSLDDIVLVEPSGNKWCVTFRGRAAASYCKDSNFKDWERRDDGLMTIEIARGDYARLVEYLENKSYMV